MHDRISERIFRRLAETEYRMKTTFLEQIDSPEDLKRLPDSAMQPLAEEIRAFLIEAAKKNGGHLASNLGVVELTLALHRVFDFSHDHLILDVGHQCYVHKLLTGRREAFGSLRRIGGLSGFTKRSESIYDCFGAGHSSTSLSAAVGFAEADYLKGSDAYTVAVVGDGAFTGGMIHEALNNCNPDRRMIIILNENEMSISKNIGAFARHIAKIRASAGYYRTKKTTGKLISHIPLVGKSLFRVLRRLKVALKNAMYGSNYFEDLGLYYLGPIDGNDYGKVKLLLQEAVSYGKSAVIHIKTRKGLGFEPAEHQPDLFHSVSAGALAQADGVLKTEKNFSARFGELLTDMARENEKICAVTAAMSEGTGLELFRKTFPSRFFDVGIAEEHALTFSAGLAADGMRPYFAVYSSFLQRGYDNLIHDIALQSLPVTVMADRAGLSAADGSTHHGIFDVSFLSGIPGVTLFAPVSFDSLEKALRFSASCEGLCAIRYANAAEDKAALMRFGKADARLSPRADYPETEKNGKRRILLTYGKILSEVCAAELALGETCGVILLESLMPCEQNARIIAGLLPAGNAELVFVEEGIRNGGAGMILHEELERIGALNGKSYRILALSQPFSPIRPGDSVYEAYGLSKADIIACFRE